MNSPTEHDVRIAALLAGAPYREDDVPILLAQLSLAEKALRRKCVLDTYGITIENLHDDFNRWFRIVSSDEELAGWFGGPLERYVLDDLAQISLTRLQ